MTKNAGKNEDTNPVQVFGTFLSSFPSLMFKFGGAFLRFKMQAKKAGKIFQEELVNQGLDKTTASGLTEVYLNGSHLFDYMKHMYNNGQ